MRIHALLLLAAAAGCASAPQTNPAPVEEEGKSDLVSLDSALNHIRQSYTLGCVEALKGQGLKNVYPGCREKGQRHVDAVERFVKGLPAKEQP